ncbi:8027_t:CDS:2 [Funneliformis mosseae]|uniref:8027_t:CDS:1 n=1 Tax=Funneliformis mosseae TaxID=27381 RepID=A0A9N9FDL2_FUNMO|nr:8027_t:CDS:2 [Funneliformis mosseae]
MSFIVSNSPPNSQQKQRPMINSSHHKAKCKYCFEKMGGIPVNMLQHLKEDCSKISEEICDTLRFVSDSESDMAKAQRLMCQDSKIGRKVLTIPCMAYQTNLLVKKIVKSSIFEPIIKILLKIVNHFRNSNLTLAKLRELSQDLNLTPQYPCITCLATFSKIIAITHSNLLTTSRKNDNSIINAIESIDFWEKLTMFYKLLRLYDHIIMILESEHATLGQVAAT